MPRDGCHECSRRRIKCDKASPECGKCIKKGIRCTGIGVRYRFVATNAVVARQRPSSEHANQTSVHDDALGLISSPEHSERQVNDQSPIESSSHAQDLRNEQRIRRSSGTGPLSPTSISGLKGITRPASSIKLGVQCFEPGLRMLFNHFSTTIAPFMVVFDGLDNGYRNLILPLATEDELVRQAVCVVSAFHLSVKDVGLREYAETRRSALIERLVAKVSSGDAKRVFSLSTWATILVLLVCETVTGSDEFSYLFSLIIAHLENDQDSASAPTEARDFMVHQTRMFQLFTPPLLGPDVGSTILTGDLNPYLGFLSTSVASQPALAVYAQTFKDAIMLARDIYLEEAGSTYQPAALQARLNRLRTLTQPISRETPGMHVLVWTYFVAAASSRGFEDRQYFTNKLREIHDVTKMDNILIALDTLKNIWSNQHTGGWVQNIGSLCPVLAM